MNLSNWQTDTLFAEIESFLLQDAFAKSVMDSFKPPLPIVEEEMKPFGCTKCDQTFSLVEELEQHLHTHADGEDHESSTGMLTITYI